MVTSARIGLAVALATMGRSCEAAFDALVGAVPTGLAADDVAGEQNRACAVVEAGYDADRVALLRMIEFGPLSGGGSF